MFSKSRWNNRKNKIKKEEIDEIILIGGATRTLKIKEINEKYFNKKSLERINVDDIISYNKFLFQILKIIF